MPKNSSEQFFELLKHKNVKINKIISPPNFQSEEFCQDDDEFVFLAQGEAVLQIESDLHTLKTGEHLFIKRGQKHKILSTSPECETIWLAVHIL